MFSIQPDILEFRQPWDAKPKEGPFRGLPRKLLQRRAPLCFRMDAIHPRKLVPLLAGNQPLALGESQEAPGSGRGSLSQHTLPCRPHLLISEMGARSPERLYRSLVWITVNVQEAI